MTEVINLQSNLFYCYPETFLQYNCANNLKLLRQKKWKSTIYSNLNNNIDVTNLFGITSSIPFSWDKILIPENILMLIKKNNPTKETLDFVPSEFIFKCKNLKQIEPLVFNKIEKNIGLKLCLELVSLKKYVCDEFIDFIHPNGFGNTDANSNLNELIFHSILKTNSFIIYSKDFNDLIIFNKYSLIVLTSNYIFVIPNIPEENNYLLMTNGKTYLKNNDFESVENTKKEFENNNPIYRIYGYIKNSNKIQTFNYSIDSELNVKKIYDYTNKETKLKIKHSSITFTKKGISYTKYIKSGCEFEEYYNYNTGFRRIISECMIGIGNENGNNDGSGLRYRGKYTQTSSNGENIKKTITIEDKIVYNKEGDETKTNTLVDKNKYINRTDIIIGYKVAKSARGDLRIIKLGITPDAQIVRPIDEEYFITNNKERCDKAIVMDIQLPIKEEEISVVPEESVAYSYVYKSGKTDFDYKIGSEVIPDSFNPDEDVGCANGIHYFQSRLDLFKAYID